MLTPEKNRQLTEVGPGTPMGEVLRRHWHPIAGIDELEREPVKPVRLMGEDLVLFKDLGGRYGLVDRHCAHRRADLSYGYVEEYGIRCNYHGWQFDAQGACVAQPFEEQVDPSARMRCKVRLKAYEVRPLAGLLWAYLGDAYRGAKKYPEAIEAYQKALAITPNSGVYHNALADAYAKAGQTDKAIAEWNTAAQVEPANAATYYFNEGAILTNAGKVDDANAAFDKVIQIDPKKADAYYWKGVNLTAKMTTGKDNKVIAPPGTAEAFNKYLELDPSGKYADAAKQMLETIGASIQTTYGKQKSASTKKQNP